MTTVAEALATHEFFAALAPEHLDVIGRSGSLVAFDRGAHILTADSPADLAYALTTGRVAIEIEPPHRGPLIIETVGSGDLLGISWLLPPYRWTFDARASEPTTAVALDAAALRNRCDEDPTLGYELYRRAAGVIGERLQAARLRLLDLYGDHGS